MGTGAVFWASLAMIGAGTLLALFGLILAARLSWLYRRSTRAEGRVVGVERLDSADGDFLYRSVIEFTAGDRVWTVLDSMSSVSPLHTVGQRLPLYFPKDDPVRAAVWRPWWFAVFAGVSLVGVFFAVAASLADWSGP